jgi:hypothetical protein
MMHTGIVKRSPGIAGAVSAIALIVAACGSTHTSNPVTVTVTAAPPAQTSVAPSPTVHLFKFNTCFVYPGLVRISAVNISSRPQVFTPRDQRLQDSQKREFAPELNDIDPPRQVNPGDDWFGDIRFWVSGHQEDYRLLLRDATGVFADIPLTDCEWRGASQ